MVERSDLERFHVHVWVKKQWNLSSQTLLLDHSLNQLREPIIWILIRSYNVLRKGRTKIIFKEGYDPLRESRRITAREQQTIDVFDNRLGEATSRRRDNWHAVQQCDARHTALTCAHIRQNKYVRFGEELRDVLVRNV